MRATLLLVTVFLLFSCKTENSAPAANFDRRAMLTDYADHRIIPAFERLEARTAALLTAVQTLADQPTVPRLEDARQAWRAAFYDWQAANGFNFGPAAEQGLRKSLAEEIGTFPASPAKMQQYIAAGDTSFNNFDRDTRGFMALDYLLWDGDTQAAADKLAADAKRRAYLLATTRHVHREVKTIRAAWSNYRAEFIAKNGSDAGSSTSALYNEFVRSYEVLKNFKIGLPLGKRVGQSASEPGKVEAYYSGESLEAVRRHFNALVELWEGRDLNGVDRTGFKDYLAAVEGGPALITSTEAQIAVIRQKLDELAPGISLSNRIETAPASLEPLYAALSQHTRYFKSDMSSLLGIYITYASGDGD